MQTKPSTTNIMPIPDDFCDCDERCPKCGKKKKKKNPWYIPHEPYTPWVPFSPYRITYCFPNFEV